jgi:hypothetical protein
MRDIMQLRLRRCFPVGEVLRNIFDVWCQVATASIFGRLPMQSPHPIALRKEAAGVAREAQAERVRNGAPASLCFFRIARPMQGERKRARVLSSLRKGPWRGTKPRKDRAPAGWQRSDGVTDSTAEQSLEADAPIKRISKGRLWQRS